ncbi:histone-lysine N-methyltransferase ATXR2, partial [Trifolium medium]|nr:histone-lysine N-methyltransferase ATXR2 [Trifolium medium]
MVVLRKLAFGEDPNNVNLDTADIWVQVHQLPYGFMNEQI